MAENLGQAHTDAGKRESRFIERIDALDVFRGVAVFLAILNHYGYLISTWYSSYLRVIHFNDPDYASHQQAFRDGRHLNLDVTAQTLNESLGPWVNHLYLFLAAFNIALKDKESVRLVLGKRLGVFFALFLFFTLENAICSPSFGESWSIYPLQMWMIVLSLLNVLYALWGLPAVAFLFVLSFLRFVLPMETFSSGLEIAVKSSFSSAWEYDSRLEYFLGTGALGLLFGALYRLRWSAKVQSIVLLASAMGVALYLGFGALPSFKFDDYYAIEHFWIKTFSGSLFIFACCVFSTVVFLNLEAVIRAKGWRLWLPVLSWVGVYSLFFFAFHRILFIYIQMPVHEWWLAKQGRPFEFSFGMAFTHVLVCLLLTYGLQRLRVFEIVALSGQPKPVHKGAVR